MRYVVGFTEHLRDGTEYGAKIVATLDDAIHMIERIANSGPYGVSCTFQLFELGNEVPLKEETEIKPKPVEYEERRCFSVDNKRRKKCLRS